MLLPISLAAVQGISNKRLRTALLLSIAYGANIGGIASALITMITIAITM